MFVRVGCVGIIPSDTLDRESSREPGLTYFELLPSRQTNNKVKKIQANKSKLLDEIYMYEGELGPSGKKLDQQIQRPFDLTPENLSFFCYQISTILQI